MSANYILMYVVLLVKFEPQKTYKNQKLSQIIETTLSETGFLGLWVLRTRQY